MKLNESVSLTIYAPNDLTGDIPIVYGKLLVVPVMDVKAGELVTVHRTGLFDGPIKAGDNPAFEGEYAYFNDELFTKTAPTADEDIKKPVGVFVDNGVLLTGVLLE